MKLKTLALTTALAITGNAAAYDLQIPDSSASWYYNMGGQRAVSAPAAYNTNSIVLGGSADWGSGFNCSAFDPTLGVANTLNDVKNGADAIQQQVVSAATGAVASLPLMMLQRANPGLYELLMNSMASAQERVSVSTRSCEQMQQTISDGGNPMEDWINISRSQDWKGEMGDGTYRGASNDAVQAEENVNRNNGENGVTWSGGNKAGGRGQKPINIPTDIVKAGFNQMLNRDPNSDASVPDDGSRIAQLWDSPEDMEAFSRSVLGEEKVRTYTNRPTESTPARGLAFEINQEVEALTPKVDDLIAGNTEMSGDNLIDVSSPSVVITSGTIQSLRNMSPAETNILKTRLIQEVATARVIEKALMLIRLLLSGSQEPNIAQNGPAMESTSKYSNQLESAIDSTLFEHEMNKRLASSTSETIRAVEANKRRVGTSTRNPTTPSPTPSEAISTEDN